MAIWNLLTCLLNVLPPYDVAPINMKEINYITWFCHFRLTLFHHYVFLLLYTETYCDFQILLILQVILSEQVLGYYVIVLQIISQALNFCLKIFLHKWYKTAHARFTL